MTQRINLYAVGFKAVEPLAKIATPPELEAMGLEHRLQELVKIRASQINGCANCLHMHTSDTLKEGERPERIYLLSAWRESHMFTPREKAALGWTEALTRIAETGAPDADYEALKAHFSDEEIVALTLLIGVINTWNRLAVGLRVVHPNDKKLAA
ncbi:carboxymuconolactone decarboxylase family protein [Phenylobacterium soli]|uniref:Carboxymuconolactone decarboxylase family protein n=1 Tax=Phenylobacterium soli TaxID=2170551 RepID=A0A328ALU3_9CAUL|nr:carboxymuconolactone decarboxylase family protein [Phenylobacterium soli]RAK55527.1 carboxymuconolactone decarboxylase family protein [Phenylobacterium soli]